MSIANTHQDQLTLAEFSALRTRRLVQNLDMMAIARTVELSAKTKDANAEDENGNTDDARNGASHVQAEFMGGEHDIGEEDEIDDEDNVGRTPHPLAQMTLEAATRLLRRDDEVAAAKKKGRHREADM